MNILIICRCLSIGGAERVAASWINGLNILGHKVFVLTDTSIPQTYETDSGVNIIGAVNGIYSNLNYFKDIKNRYRYMRQISNIIDKYSIDAIVKVLHVNCIELLFARKFSKRKPPIILTDHNSYERPKSAPMPLSLYLNKFWINRLFDKVTVLTKRDKYITDKHKLKNVAVLYNPLFKKTHKIKSNDSNREKVILAIGRLDSWHYKGFDILIKAWNKVANKHLEWKLRIIGHGSESSKSFLYSLSEYPIQFEIQDFKKNISEEYANSEIFVLSSRYEGWGLVLVEAMSCGCACIACDYKGRQSEIIHNHKDGVLCNPEDINSLAESIENLIVNENERITLQRNAYGNIDRFSEPSVAKNLDFIIRTVVKK